VSRRRARAEPVRAPARQRYNVIVGNGCAVTTGVWGAQAGISLSSNPGCVVERNLIIAKREGFNFREQLRSTPTIDDRREHPVWNRHQLTRQNIIVFNRDAQVWGWFDVKDVRHWPGGSTGTHSAAVKPGDRPGASTATTDDGQPQGLTLENLRLQFEKNVDFAAPGRGWFNWGPTWARHKSYAGSSEFQSDLRLDTYGQVLDPGFADVRRWDFQLSAEMMARLNVNYPRQPVPGVLLGVKP
jgi:hypothetical protein